MRPSPLAAGMLAALLVAAMIGAVSAPAAGAAVVLNEVECDSDWVELVNTSADPADISGWLLTDDPLMPASPRASHRMLFAASTAIPGHGVMTVDKGTVAGTFPFGVSCADDTIRLADENEALVDEIALHPLTPTSDTLGRYPSGTGSWAQTVPTKGAANELSTGGGGPPVDQAAWLYDPGQVVQIALTLPQSSIDALNADPGEYVDGTFALTATGGTYGPMNVGIRLKGGVGSFRDLDHKAAFKIKFNHSIGSQRFVGLKKLTLNNMVQDPSMIHEVLAYDLFRGRGVAAPRTGYASVKVNGETKGLYLNVETLDDVSLPHSFISTAHLYEGEYGVDVKPEDAANFQVDEGSDSDRADLEALIAATDAGGDWSDGVSAFADLAEMTRMWAVEKYAGHWDGYSGMSDPSANSHLLPNNYYLHSDSAGKFSVLPWGTDQTWDQHLAFDGPAGVLFNRCLADTDCAAMYREAVGDVVAAAATLDLDTRATDAAAVLRPWQSSEPVYSYPQETIDAGVSSTRAFLAARPGEASAWLDPPPVDPPPGTQPPGTETGSSPPPAVTPSKPGPLAAAAGLAPLRVSGGVLITPLTLAVGGRLSQRATITLGRRVMTVCRAFATRTQAGSLTLRCRLSADAKRLLRSRSLKLTVRLWFRPAGGGLTAFTHSVTARRAPALR